MKLSSILLGVAVSVSLLSGCKKKEAEKADVPAGSGTAVATNAGTAAAEPTGAGTAAGTGAAPAAGGLEEVKQPPEGMPADCTKAYDAMVKLHGCEKHPVDHRAPMIKAWNTAVDQSFVHYKGASDDMKATLEKSCTSMVQSTEILVKDC